MYCGNNPVNNQDSSGQFWDIALDVVFTVGSLIAVAKSPTDLKAWAALGADLICTAIPFATGGGIAVRAASKVDNVVDASRAANEVDNTTSSMTTIYRSVSSAEADDIVATGRFNLSPTGMEAKQFGLDYYETVHFGFQIKPPQSIIVSAQLPTEMLNDFYNGGAGGIDKTIFKNGTLTIYADQLDAFNSAVAGTIKIM